MTSSILSTRKSSRYLGARESISGKQLICRLYRRACSASSGLLFCSERRARHGSRGRPTPRRALVAILTFNDWPSPLLVWMHPNVGRNLARFGQLDHVHRWHNRLRCCIAASRRTDHWLWLRASTRTRPRSKPTQQGQCTKRGPRS